MEMLNEKILQVFKYESKAEMQFHMELMKNNGWKKESVGHMMFPYYKSFSKEISPVTNKDPLK